MINNEIYWSYYVSVTTTDVKTQIVMFTKDVLIVVYDKNKKWQNINEQNSVSLWLMYSPRDSSIWYLLLLRTKFIHRKEIFSFLSFTTEKMS